MTHPISGPVINVHESIINVAPIQIHHAVIPGVAVEVTSNFMTLACEFFFNSLDDQLTLTNNDTVSSEGKHLHGHNQKKVDTRLALNCIVFY